MTNNLPADPATTAIKEAARLAEQFLGKLVNPALEEGGGILSDTVKFWRFKNQVNIVLNARDFLVLKGIEPKQVLPKTLISILEAGSLEEEVSMQNRWAAMLAHAADDTSESEVLPGYPEILKQLSQKEVALLDAFYQEIKGKNKEEREKVLFDKQKATTFLGISEEKYEVLLENLFRFGLCSPPASRGGVQIGKYPVMLRTYDSVELTPLGIDFVKSCRYPN